MRRTMLAMLVLIAIAACQRAPAPANGTAQDRNNPGAPASVPPVTAPPSPAVANPATPPPQSPLPEGTDVTYQCQDGNQFTVTYTYVTADLHWPDGRGVQLSRVASASKGAGDVYVGGKVSLQHDGSSVQLQEGGATAVACSESAATA